MDRLYYILVWLSRIHHVLGFGIQSPTDYQFVRTVVNEHSPYYAYDWLGCQDGWLRRKLGLLCFRLANWRQPLTCIDRVGKGEYVVAGSRKTRVCKDASPIELALLGSCEEARKLLDRCDERSVVLIEDIASQRKQWRSLIDSPQVTVSYDLYYCGILMFDPKRSKQNYIVNF